MTSRRPQGFSDAWRRSAGRDEESEPGCVSWARTGMFLWCGSDRAAPVAVFGVPLDETGSFRPGTRFGPKAAREASQALETHSLRQRRSLASEDCVDLGDISLPLGNVEKALKVIRAASASVLSEGKKPMAVGGEHLITLPLVESVREVYPDLVVIQMDAHADLRREYTGTAFSHATVMRRIVETLGAGKMYQLGIRSADEEELEETRGLTEMHLHGVAGPLRGILPRVAGRPVYLTIDIDVVDPAFAPGTGVPEPGGISSVELLDSLSMLRGQNIVGADIVEIVPAYDLAGQTALLAAAVVRECLLVLKPSS